MDLVSANSTGNELAAVEERYRRLLVDRFGLLTFKGFSRSGKALSLPLEDVYVELKSVVDVPDAADAYSADERRVLLEAGSRGMHDDDLRRQLDSLRIERWREEGRRGGARLVRRSIEDAVAEPGRPGLVILGDPGSGKTTLLQYLALRAAKEGLPKTEAEASRQATTLRSAKGKPRLPIFVPLAAYDDWLRCNHGALSLAEFLPFYYEKWSSFPGLGPLFRQAFDDGSALVLLDGLDEVLDVATRRHIASQARALIQTETPRGNRFVVTSRFVGYREASLSGHLPEVSVLDFGKDEIAIFAHKWCEACEVYLNGGERTDNALQSAAKEERDLIAEVHANASVLRLAANPLLLTMLAILRRQGGKLPDERVKLYERYIDMLLDNNWETVRNDGARTREPIRFDRNLATSYLIDLALWLQRHKPSGTARRKDLEWALVEIALQTSGLDSTQASAKDRAQAQDKAELFLKDMRHFAGILAERGRDAFGFLHLTFQEYFAGRALARKEPDERWSLLKDNLHLPRWREPLLLCAGQLGLIEGRTKLVSDLGRRVLTAGSPHEEMLHRDVLLVAAIAADGVGLERGLLDELTQRLTALADGRVPAERSEALTGLAQLARFGHGGAITWLEDRIARRIQPEETARALEAVISADSCEGLRRGLRDWLDSPDFGLRSFAITALRATMASDEEVRRLVLAMLGDDAGLQAAAHELGPLVTSDTEIRGLFVAMLNHADPWVHPMAVNKLQPLIPGDEEVRRLVINRLDDDDHWVRQAAVDALKALVTSDEEVRRLILTRLDDAHDYVRSTALSALGAVATSDANVRHLILAKLDDGDAGMRRAAVVALEALVPSDEDVRHLIVSKLDDGVIGVRRAAIAALISAMASDPAIRHLMIVGLDHKPCSISHEMIAALAPLIVSDAITRNLVLGKLDDADKNVRKAATGALKELVTSDDEIREQILAKLDDTDGAVRQAAIGALKELVTSDDEIRERILTNLDDNDEGVRQAAIGALKELVTNDEDVRERTLAKLDDNDEGVRQAAIGALKELVTSDEDVRERILTKLDDNDEGVRRAAIGALREVVTSDEDVRRRILTKLDDNDEGVRWKAIGVMMPSDDEVRRLVLTEIDDTNEDVRFHAVRTLGVLVPRDEKVRRLVLAKLDDATQRVRAAAVRALAALVASDERVRELILARLDDADEHVRHAAIGALKTVVIGDLDVQSSIIATLEDRSFRVRMATVSMLAPLVATNQDLRKRLLQWFGVIADRGQDHDLVRYRLAVAYAPFLEQDPELLAQVVAMLHAPAWPTRKGSAWALIAMPGGPPPDLLPLLRDLLEDQRGDESWSERLDTAALLINDRDSSLSRHAIAVTVSALDYGMDPWCGREHFGSIVRAQAAMVLGTLEPDYRNEAIFVRLTRVLLEDNGDNVRDAAYAALLRLAVSPEIEHEVESLLVSSSKPTQLSPEAPRPTMQSLPRSLVLHLSDLHFGTVENANIWFSQLAEDLHDLGHTHLDAVILSGDIANLSAADEYAAARTFLEKLLRELHLSKQQLIIVPGNHDLNWSLAKKGYKLKEREDYSGRLVEGHFIEVDKDTIRVRDDARYAKRFEPFAAFYEAVRGEPYPLAPTEQAILYPLPTQRLLVVGLNSAWDLDHHFKTRASIHTAALARALDQIRNEPSYKELLKIAVWHHPVQSSSEDRIKDHGFLDRLANADFRIGLHGHIHKAETNLYRYDRSPAGRRIELVCAGTFGAPTRELVPGYPFQYQLLRFEGSTLTVETRRREEVHGTWKPDARWTSEKGTDPAPRYQLAL